MQLSRQWIFFNTQFFVERVSEPLFSGNSGNYTQKKKFKPKLENFITK